MINITLNKVNFLNATNTHQRVTVEYKILQQPDSTYVLVDDSALLLKDGTFSPPIVISNLQEGIDWRIKVTMNCNAASTMITINSSNFATTTTSTSSTTSSTTQAICIPPYTVNKEFMYGYTENDVDIDFSTGTVEHACAAISYIKTEPVLTTQSYILGITALIVGEPVYSDPSTCSLAFNGNYVIDGGTDEPKVVTILNGYITAINSCSEPTTTVA